MFFTTVTAGGQAVRVLTHSTPPNGYVQAAYPLTEVNRTIAGLDHALLLLIPVALLAAGLGGAGLTARVLRPVKQMTQAAAAMGDAPAARLPAQGEDEFAQMAATFNGLLGRLDASFQRQSQILDQQRRFTADASHELKSPLTVILGTANQISYGGLSEPEVCAAAAEIAAAAAGMARLVQDLLLLARSDEGRLGQNKIRVPVREVACSGHCPHGPARLTCCAGSRRSSLLLWQRRRANPRVRQPAAKRRAGHAAGRKNYDCCPPGRRGNRGCRHRYGKRRCAGASARISASGFTGQIRPGRAGTAARASASPSAAALRRRTAGHWHFPASPARVRQPLSRFRLRVHEK